MGLLSKASLHFMFKPSYRKLYLAYTYGDSSSAYLNCRIKVTKNILSMITENIIKVKYKSS